MPTSDPDVAAWDSTPSRPAIHLQHCIFIFTSMLIIIEVKKVKIQLKR